MHFGLEREWNFQQFPKRPQTLLLHFVQHINAKWQSQHWLIWNQYQSARNGVDEPRVLQNQIFSQNCILLEVSFHIYFGWGGTHMTWLSASIHTWPHPMGTWQSVCVTPLKGGTLSTSSSSSFSYFSLSFSPHKAALRSLSLSPLPSLPLTKLPM